MALVSYAFSLVIANEKLRPSGEGDVAIKKFGVYSLLDVSICSASESTTFYSSLIALSPIFLTATFLLLILKTPGPFLGVIYILEYFELKDCELIESSSPKS